MDSRPNRFAVRVCHDVSPKGAPRTTDRRNASNSASVWGTPREKTPEPLFVPDLGYLLLLPLPVECHSHVSVPNVKLKEPFATIEG